jgi:single-strand DNA-binding protein
MADGLNRCEFIGNLAADPELRSTNSGQSVLKFRLGCSETYLDRNKVRQEKTEWVSFVLWGKRGESLSRILHKGDRVFVEGSFSTTSYEDKDQKKCYKTEINVRNVILCGGNRSGGQRQEPESTGEPTSGGEPEDDFGF